MKRAAWITAAAWAAFCLFTHGVVRAQGIRVRHKDGSGTKVGMGERKGSKNDLKTEKERIKRGCRRHLGKAEKLTAEGNYGLACRELVAARALTIERELAQQWASLAKRLNQIGLEQLRQADKAYEQKDYPKVLTEYERVSVTFIGLPVSAQARNGLSQARHDPEVQAALKEIRAQKLIKLVEAIAAPVRRPTTAPATPRSAAAGPKQAPPNKLDAKTIAALDDEKLIRVVDSLENLVKVCGGAPTAEKVAGMLKQLNADPGMKARLARARRVRKAEQALRMAETYHKAGLSKKAAELYRQVMEEFSGSSQAAEAAAQLSTLEAALANP
jgi:hypothetical protein